MDSPSKRSKLTDDCDMYFDYDEKPTTYKMYRWQLNYKKWNEYMDAPMQTTTLVNNYYIWQCNDLIRLIYFPNMSYRQYVKNLTNTNLYPLKTYIEKMTKFYYMIV